MELYDIAYSTTLESNKSHCWNQANVRLPRKRGTTLLIGLPRS